MKVSLQRIKQWVDVEQDTQEIAHMLTMAGLEVESISPAAADFSEVYVGQVVAIQKHPDADRLSLCQVDVGELDTLQIICGAPNVRNNLKVAVAKVGASLPGIKIKKAKMRGVESFGMLCSETELGLSDQSEGIIELPVDAPIGSPLREYFGLDDQVLDVSITPNRGDCVSVLGISREIAALTGSSLLPCEFKEIKPVNESSLEVSLQSDNACPKYVGRVINRVNCNAPSPIWLSEFLRRSGLRSISLVVDITNFIMIELGIPMHAFDLKQISGGIHVRYAKEGEKLTSLDGQELNLNENTLLICDEKRPLALAGVIGGADSAVTPETTDIFLECAYFNPETVAEVSRRLQLHTDAAYRFERGVDYTMQERAIEYATQLIISLAGGEAGVVNNVTLSEHMPQQAPVTLRFSRVNKLLGVEVAPADIEKTFLKLAMPCDMQKDHCVVTVPPYRSDITIEEDLVEEVLRFRGCDSIQEQPPIALVTNRKDVQSAHSMNLPREILKQRDFHEIISYSFVDEQLLACLNPIDEALKLKNPISKEMSVMRTSLWAGLISTAIHNQNRQQSRIRLFEHGQCFIQGPQGLQQRNTLAGLILGNTHEAQWGKKAAKVDFFDLKADVEVLLSSVGLLNQCSFVAEERVALHPGQSARIYLKGVAVGWLGVLHPKLVQKFKFDHAPVLFELDYEHLSQQKPERSYRAISKFPIIHRDIAFLLDQSVASADVITHVEGLREELLLSIRLFDKYVGEGIPADKQSLAFSITIQDISKTLLDADVANVLKRVIDSIEATFNATLRE